MAGAGQGRGGRAAGRGGEAGGRGTRAARKRAWSAVPSGPDREVSVVRCGTLYLLGKISFVIVSAKCLHADLVRLCLRPMNANLSALWNCWTLPPFLLSRS